MVLTYYHLIVSRFHSARKLSELVREYERGMEWKQEFKDKAAAIKNHERTIVDSEEEDVSDLEWTLDYFEGQFAPYHSIVEDYRYKNGQSSETPLNRGPLKERVFDMNWKSQFSKEREPSKEEEEDSSLPSQASVRRTNSSFTPKIGQSSLPLEVKLNEEPLLSSSGELSSDWDDFNLLKKMSDVVIEDKKTLENPVKPGEKAYWFPQSSQSNKNTLANQRKSLIDDEVEKALSRLAAEEDNYSGNSEDDEDDYFPHYYSDRETEEHSKYKISSYGDKEQVEKIIAYDSLHDYDDDDEGSSSSSIKSLSQLPTASRRPASTLSNHNQASGNQRPPFNGNYESKAEFPSNRRNFDTKNNNQQQTFWRNGNNNNREHKGHHGRNKREEEEEEEEELKRGIAEDFWTIIDERWERNNLSQYLDEVIRPKTFARMGLIHTDSLLELTYQYINELRGLFVNSFVAHENLASNQVQAILDQLQEFYRIISAIVSKQFNQQIGEDLKVRNSFDRLLLTFT